MVAKKVSTCAATRENFTSARLWLRTDHSMRWRASIDFVVKQLFVRWRTPAQLSVPLRPYIVSAKQLAGAAVAIVSNGTPRSRVSVPRCIAVFAIAESRCIAIAFVVSWTHLEARTPLGSRRRLRMACA